MAVSFVRGCALSSCHMRYVNLSWKNPLNVRSTLGVLLSLRSNREITSLSAGISLVGRAVSRSNGGELVLAPGAGKAAGNYRPLAWLCTPPGQVLFMSVAGRAS